MTSWLRARILRGERPSLSPKTTTSKKDSTVSISPHSHHILDIWKSCKEGNLDMTRIMIREGQDVNEKTQEKGNSALHIAARNGHYLIVKYLLDIGTEIMQTNEAGQTSK